MKYHVLACDYDGTLAHEGRVEPAHVAALQRLKNSGRKLVLVTGRQLSDLRYVFPEFTIFDLIVAENGAVLYTPASHEERLLVEPASDLLLSILKGKGVDSAVAGRCIIATWEPHEAAVLEAIREIGLELEVIFNKGAVMVLPTGVNKATGLQAALCELGLSEHNAIAIGDAENDHALLALCKCAVSVANAIPSVRQQADYVTVGDHGAGVVELIDMLLENDCQSIKIRNPKHPIVLGYDADGEQILLEDCSGSVLICGPSGSGKTTAAIGLVEQFVDAGYQFCLIDPERDFDSFEGAVVLGSSERPPSLEEIVQLMQAPDKNVVVSLLGMPVADRPGFFAALLPHLQKLKETKGRPHCLIVDEAHYLMPSEKYAAEQKFSKLEGTLLITVHPNHLAHNVLNMIDTVIAVGMDKKETLSAFCQSVGQPLPLWNDENDESEKNTIWFCKREKQPFFIRPWRAKREHRRHKRKYAEGDLGAYHSFYFTGQERRLNLRANNLTMFLHIAFGLDDGTWLFHLRRHDYSRWFKNSIKDDLLAKTAEAVENAAGLSAGESRKRIKLIIEARYSPPA